MSPLNSTTWVLLNCWTLLQATFSHLCLSLTRAHPAIYHLAGSKFVRPSTGESTPVEGRKWKEYKNVNHRRSFSSSHRHSPAHTAQTHGRAPKPQLVGAHARRARLPLEPNEVLQKLVRAHGKVGLPKIRNSSAGGRSERPNPEDEVRSFSNLYFHANSMKATRKKHRIRM